MGKQVNKPAGVGKTATVGAAASVPVVVATPAPVAAKPPATNIVAALQTALTAAGGNPANVQALLNTAAAQGAAAAAKPVTVALRGGPAVVSVQMVPGAVYRTKAPHNVAWWQAVQAAMANGPAPVATLVQPAPAGSGVPSHFVGYCLRRGYLQAVA